MGTTRDYTKMAASTGCRMAGRACWLILGLLPLFLGGVSGNHLSNGISVRLSRNTYSRRPAEYTSTYVNDAKRTGVRSQRTTWPGLNNYYQPIVNNYTAHVKGGTYVRLTSAPPDTALGVCVNFEQLDPNDNSSYLGVFVCPLAFEPRQNTFCCGNQFAEYCCEPEENRISEIVGPVIVLPMFVTILIVGFWSCCCRKEVKEDEEVIHGNTNEVTVGERSPSKNQDYRAASEVPSAVTPDPDNGTSCTSLGSEADNGYGSGSGPLTGTRPLSPAYPALPRDDEPPRDGDQEEEDGEEEERQERGYQSPVNKGDNRSMLRPNNEADMRLSDPSLLDAA